VKLEIIRGTGDAVQDDRPETSQDELCYMQLITSHETEVVLIKFIWRELIKVFPETIFQNLHGNLVTKK
jgi:hypothetical protein